ncbi:hypothetical protein Ciccas_009653 [Cichlidogyrus casuarinus]|uniref:C2H2-type domain-containing protein n=1 Tax=Cichlidogyrus casuarinus TaxID=1844966 RepID=A0ABD2PWG2_9PLAT
MRIIESSKRSQQTNIPSKSNDRSSSSSRSSTKSKKRDSSTKSNGSSTPTPHESKSDKKDNKKSKTCARNDTPRRSSKKGIAFEVEQNLVEFDVKSASELSACKLIFCELRKEKEALDLKMYKLFKKIQKLMMERQKTLLQVYDQYAAENQEKHDLAVKVLKNFMKKHADSSEPIKFLEEDIGEPLPRDMRHGVSILHRLYRSEDWGSFDDKIFTKFAQMDETENKNMDDSSSLNLDSEANLHRDFIPNEDQLVFRSNEEEFCPPDSSTNLQPPSPSTPLQRLVNMKSEPIDSLEQNQVDQAQGQAQLDPHPNLDYQRLELIREALQDPEAANYTCDNFHLILQKIAKSRGFNPEIYFPEANKEVVKSTVLNEPPAEPRPPPSVHIQHEMPQLVKFKQDATSPPLRKRSISPDPNQESLKRCRQSSAETVDDSAISLPIGDFHAFGNKITAVVDMHIVGTASSNESTVKLLAGSQDGTINLLDMQKKSILRTFIRQGSSVTKMCLNSDHTILLSGFYDNRLYTFRVRDGFMLDCKTLGGRVECCISVPRTDFEHNFLLGLTTGQVVKFSAPNMSLSQLFQHSWNNKSQSAKAFSSTCAISSLAVVPGENSEPVLVVGAADCSITIRSLTSGHLLHTLTANQHMAPPMGLAKFPYGSDFIILSYSAKTFKLHDFKNDTAIYTLSTPGITSCCMLQRFLASGDTDGAIRLYKTLWNSINNRPYKVFFTKAKSAVTCLATLDSKLLAGSMDGTITVITLNDDTYLCEYDSSSCRRQFKNISELIDHVYETHLMIASSNSKSFNCGWASGRCKHRFNKNQSMRSMRDHLLSHLSDKSC